jgi:hypothetical protein
MVAALTLFAEVDATRYPQQLFHQLAYLRRFPRDRGERTTLIAQHLLLSARFNRR